MARLLEVWKHLRDIETDQRDRVWNEIFGTEVGSRRLLIAGLGSIGREIARRARAFDMHVIATRGSAQPGDTDPDVDELFPVNALDELLPTVDAVVCALPTSPATTDLFDAGRFQLMKSDAIFCNIGRGTLVVESDLIATLEAGHLRAAILDVMRTEPLPEDPTPTERRAAMTWAQRLKRVFNIDIETCKSCGGAVKIIACIEDPLIIKKILTHLGTWFDTCPGRATKINDLSPSFSSEIAASP